MTCKTELDNPFAVITNINADVVYENDIPNPFVSRLYKFNVNEPEVVTFNISVIYSGGIDIYLQLYKFDDNLAEYIPVGTSVITQVINIIDYDTTVGLYAFCLTSTTTPITYSLSLSFTDFPYIVFPIATCEFGSSTEIEFNLVTILECDKELRYDLISGSLPPGLQFNNNGVIEGYIGELDCMTNNKYTIGLDSNYPRFEVEFEHGSHSYIYNYNPDDFIVFTGSEVEIDLFTNQHSNQDFHVEVGSVVEIDLQDTRQYEIYTGGELNEINFNVYPRVLTNGSNYDITDEIPPSFSLVNNTQGNEEEYYATQVEWEFRVRAYFLEDPTAYKDRFFKICVSNNWDYDRKNFLDGKDDTLTEVFIEDTLLDVESKDVFVDNILQITSDNTDIPTQPTSFQSNLLNIIEENDAISKLNELAENELDIELCEPCEVIELPRIRDIDISGLCVCILDEDVSIVEPEIPLVIGIPIYCGVDFVNNMSTQMACSPILPCGQEPIYIRTPDILEKTITFEDKCLNDCL